MFERVFKKQNSTIGSAAFILGAAALLSRLLGLVRDRVLAGLFGAGDELDIYYAAFRIPDLVYALLVMGAVSAGFIPVFLDYYQEKKRADQAWYLTSDLLNIIALGLMVICLALFVLMPYLIKLVTPGFGPAKLAWTVRLSRLMLLSPFFMGLSAVIGGVLQSFRRFLFYSLAPVAYNLGIIFGALVLVKYFGLIGLAGGVVLGALLHLLIQLPPAYFCGFRWRAVFDLTFKGLKRLARIMPPRFLSLVLSQLTILALTVIASFLAVGSLAIYNLSFNIWSFPLGIFGLSFVLASFPHLSEQAQKKNLAKFNQVFASAARQILFYTLPATVLFIVLREELVRVILGVGRFDWSDTVLAFETLGYFSLGLFAEALVLLFLRGFFAWEDSRTPFLIGLIVFVSRLLLADFLASFLGVSGLGLAYALGSIFNLILLWLALKKKIDWLDSRSILKGGGKMFLAAVLAGLAAYGLLRALALVISRETGWGIFIQGLLAGLLGLLVYLWLTRFFRLKESKSFLSVFVQHLSFRD